MKILFGGDSTKFRLYKIYRGDSGYCDQENLVKEFDKMSDALNFMTNLLENKERDIWVYHQLRAHVDTEYALFNCE